VAVSGTTRAVVLRLLGTHPVGDPVEKDEVRERVSAVVGLVEAEGEGETERRHIQWALFLGSMVLGIVLGSRRRSSGIESKATAHFSASRVIKCRSFSV